MKIRFLIFFLGLLQFECGYSQMKETSLLGIWEICEDSINAEQIKASIHTKSYIKIFSSDNVLLNLLWDDTNSLARIEKGTYDIISTDRYVETIHETELSNADKEVWFEFKDPNMLKISYLLPGRNNKHYEYWKRISPSILLENIIPADTIYSKVDNMPEFPGGIPALSAFLTKNLRYPYEPFHEQRLVTVTFVVEKDGSLSNLRIVRSGGHIYFDKEVLRLMKSMPKWAPGLQDGNPVRVYGAFPVNFRLQ